VSPEKAIRWPPFIAHGLSRCTALYDPARLAFDATKIGPAFHEAQQIIESSFNHQLIEGKLQGRIAVPVGREAAECLLKVVDWITHLIG
jgi:hypothetical protein